MVAGCLVIFRSAEPETPIHHLREASSPKEVARAVEVDIEAVF